MTNFLLFEPRPTKQPFNSIELTIEPRNNSTAPSGTWPRL